MTMIMMAVGIAAFVGITFRFTSRVALPAKGEAHR